MIKDATNCASYLRRDMKKCGNSVTLPLISTWEEQILYIEMRKLFALFNERTITRPPLRRNPPPRMSVVLSSMTEVILRLKPLDLNVLLILIFTHFAYTQIQCNLFGKEVKTSKSYSQFKVKLMEIAALKKN